MKEYLTLNGLKMEIIDTHSIFILAIHDHDYIILRRDASHEYTVMQNLHDNVDLALREFNRIIQQIK